MSACFNVIFNRGEGGINSAERLLKLGEFYIENSRSVSANFVGHNIYFFLTSVPLMRRRAEQIWL